MKLEEIERFFSRVNRLGDNDCWMWMAGKDQDGYGAFRLNGKQRRAHRLSWEIYYGEIPAGRCVLHRCDHPSCVNPNHLFIGSVAENNTDRAIKKRSAYGERNGARKYRDRVSAAVKKARVEKPEVFVRGERCHTSKLTVEQVKQIRSLYASGEKNQVQLAEMFGISQANISYLILRKSWKHI